MARLSSKARRRRSAGAWAAAQAAGGSFVNLSANDAVAGTYTLNGSPATLADVIDLASDDLAFNPEADIDAGGMHTINGNRRLPLKNPLKTALLTDGYTLVVEAYLVSGQKIIVYNYSDDYSEFAQFDIGSTGIDLYAYVGEVEHDQFATALEYTTASVNRIAMTIDNTHMAVSLNGSAPVVGSFDALIPAFTRLYIELNGTNTLRLRSFAFYEPVDDAELAGLSTL